MSERPGDLSLVYEARLAEAMTRDPDVRGRRELEAASGLVNKVLVTTLPDEGQVSAHGLIRCYDRGMWDPQAPKVGLYGVVQNTGLIGPAVTDSSSIYNPEPVDMEGNRNKTHAPSCGSNQTGIEEALAIGRERLLDDRVVAVLDPARDLWAPRTSKTTAVPSVGHRGWALAVLLGLADVTMTMADIRTLTGLSEEQNRRLVRDLQTAGMAMRKKSGRTVTVEFFWDRFLVDRRSPWYMGEEEWARADRAHAKRVAAYDERKRVKRLATPEGRLAHKVAGDRERWLHVIPDPGPRWTALVQHASEEELAAYLHRPRRGIGGRVQQADTSWAPPGLTVGASVDSILGRIQMRIGRLPVAITAPSTAVPTTALTISEAA